MGESQEEETSDHNDRIDGHEAYNGGNSKRDCNIFNKCRDILIIALITAILTIVIIYNASLKSLSLPMMNSFSLKSDPLTIGNVQRNDMEICEGNQMKRSFPDFDYALYGYNIIYGYPLATGHDPGLTHPIFDADYSGHKQTADCRYHVPYGYYLTPDVSCVTSFSSATIKDSKQFSKHLSVSAEASGGGWGVSFSASSEYKRKSSKMSASESVFIFSRASCNYYYAMLNEQDPPPFTKEFINVVKNIKTQKDVFKFFDYYGTHFLKYTLFGARFIYEYEMSQRSFQSSSSEEVSVSAKASYSGLFSLSGGFGMSSSAATAAQSFQSQVKTKTISIGAPPPANGDTMTWASTVKETPIPVKYKMESMEQLFTERYFGRYNIEFNETIQLIEAGKRDYCSHLKAKGVVDGCEDLRSDFLTLKGLSIDGGTKFSYNEEQCIERCLEDNQCIAVKYLKGGICYIHRNLKAETKAKADPLRNSNVMIFYDALKLLSKTLILKNIRVGNDIEVRSNLVVNSSYSCSEKCMKDPICSVFTFREKTMSGVTNCWLYNLEKISCKGVTQGCNSLKKSDDFLTFFNPIALSKDKQEDKQI